jgi:dienelactone hydrolase
MRSIVTKLMIGILASAVMGSGRSAAFAPPFWGKLAPGPHAVGFRSVWELDYSRAYKMVFDDKTVYGSVKSPRPILINIWYPAVRTDSPKPMPHRDYLAIQTTDPRLAKFAAKLLEYELAFICKFLMRKTGAELTDQERRLLDQFWDTPTASFRDAPPKVGKFPLVIYHQGYGSSFEDNAVLCEFLASHGYAVLSSAFQESSGETFIVDGRQGSARDLEFLIAFARRFSYVDWNRIGLVGHSAGAQAALLYRAQDASPVDAVVSLDTSQDYSGLADPGWDDMTKPILENSRNMNGPLLIAANAYAVFQLADSLKHANRYYLTFRNLNHSDFVGLGILRRTLESNAKPDNRDLRVALEAARSSYEAICNCTLEFFNAYLGKETIRQKTLFREYLLTTLGGVQPHVDQVPAGVTGPEPFRDDSTEPPTPRQFWPLLAKRGLESTLALLKQYHQEDPAAPVFNEGFGESLVDVLFDKGQVPDAVAVYRLYCSFDRSFSKNFVREGEMRLRYASKAVPCHTSKRRSRSTPPTPSQPAD